MFTRMWAGVALGCSAVFLTGCESRTEPEKGAPPRNPAAAAAKDPSPAGTTAAPGKGAPTDKKAAAASRAITLHVKGMTERLKLV
jgi:hypothetical protein